MSNKQTQKLHESYWDYMKIYPNEWSLFLFRFKVNGIKNAIYTSVAPREYVARNFIHNMDNADGNEEIESVFLINRDNKELAPTEKWAR